MQTDYPYDPRQLEDLKSRISQQLERISKNVKLETVAELIGAKDFLRYKPLGRGKAPVLILDVKSFCEYLLIQNKNIKLPENYINTGRVILPPDKGEIITGSGTGIERKEVIPRDLYLVHLLGELNQDYFILDGKNTPNMMRSLSYKIFVIPGLKKAVFVNNEEGNATFVIHNLENANPEESLQWASFTKEQLKKESEQGQVSFVVWSGEPDKWKIELRDVLLFNSSAPKRKHEAKSSNAQNYELAEEGDETNGGLSEKLRTGYKIIKDIADSFRSEHPEWFVEKLNHQGRVFEYYRPNLVAIITKQIESRPQKAEKGFETNGGLAKKLGVSQKTIKDIADSFRSEHPECFVEKLDAPSRKAEHYHPDLVALITNKIKSRPEKAEIDFETSNSLARKLGLAYITVEKNANSYRISNPEWFTQRVVKKGNVIAEHYHPDLVALISKEVGTRPEKAEAGFETSNRLAKILGVDRQYTIKRIADRYRNSHPEWFVKKLDFQKHVTEHYHPALIALITEEVNKHKHPV